MFQVSHMLYQRLQALAVFRLPCCLIQRKTYFQIFSDEFLF